MTVRRAPAGPLTTKPYLKGYLLLLFAVLLSFNACDWSSDDSGSDQPVIPTVKVEVPPFNADSAYYYIEKQVSFGPRVPNTEAHRLAGDWLIQKMDSVADKVYVQKGKVEAFDGTKLAV